VAETLEGADTRVQSLQHHIDVWEADRDELADRLRGLELRVAEREKERADAKVQLEAAVTQIEGQVSALRRQVSELEERVPALQEEVLELGALAGPVPWL
jgi:predicted  nucleic acid-binding Zn-ribbon protein